jgi:choline kinase
MRAIILAAGQGTRLRPLTDDRPKCMVEYRDKKIIDYILDSMQECNINDINIVNGYKSEVLTTYLNTKKIKYFTNEKFESTNMVYTLFCAKDIMDSDIIISYADIIYSKDILQKLIDSDDDISVVVDRKWRELWSQRMQNPLDDAETLKLDSGNIIELGKKPDSYDDIEGQYIGLIKISKNMIKKIVSFYESLDKNIMYDSKDYNNMYMTSFIQMIIDNQLAEVKPVFIDGGWIEIDSIDDLKSDIV